MKLNSSKKKSHQWSNDMGSGGRIVKCGCQEVRVLDGVGMAFPMVYQETVADIKAGKYGDTMKYIMKNMNFVTVDTTNKIYHCKKCGHLETMQVLNLYLPKDTEKIKKKVINRWTAAEPNSKMTIGELGEFPYWLPNGEDSNDFIMFYKFKHDCPICGTKMSRVKVRRITDEKCPKCGQNYQVQNLDILWD